MTIHFADSTSIDSGGSLGKLLQVVTASTSSSVSTSSGSLVDSGLTADITPSSTSSKILVLIDSPFHGIRSSGSTSTFNIRVLRDSTSVFAGGASQSDYQCGIGGSISSNRICGIISKKILDSPSSTSSLTYKLQVQSGYNLTLHMQDSTTAHITLIEVGA